MRRFNIPTLASKIAATGAIGPDDVMVLRDNLLNGEEIWPHEVRAIFDLMQKRLPACAEWSEFFVESITVYAVEELEPRGKLDEKNARFVCAMLRRDQAHWSHIDLDLARALLKECDKVPVSLQQFVLEVGQQVNAGKVWEHAPRQDMDAPAAEKAESVADLQQAAESAVREARAA